MVNTFSTMPYSADGPALMAAQAASRDLCYGQVTILTESVSDQAELFSMPNTIYDRRSSIGNLSPSFGQKEANTAVTGILAA
ncbi:MAG: hypothetical protein WBM67_12965 [Sedimenticolaceae bacterium]